MSTLETKTLINSINELLTEAYAGPPDPTVTWFVDNEPDAGILSLLAEVTAQEASTSVDGSGAAGTSIAANAEHLRWSLSNATGALRGEPYRSNWAESWHLREVDESEWDHLRQSLRAEFEALREALSEQQELPGVFLNGVLALIPHAAYHLGTMRQMLERVREG